MFASFLLLVFVLLFCFFAGDVVMDLWQNNMPCINLSNVTSDFPQSSFFANSLMIFVLLIVWLYISAILGGCFINGSIPLFYELTIETTYPIAEGIPMAVVTTSNHLACLLFLGALMIPGIGKRSN